MNDLIFPFFGPDRIFGIDLSAVGKNNLKEKSHLLSE